MSDISLPTSGLPPGPSVPTTVAAVRHDLLFQLWRMFMLLKWHRVESCPRQFAVSFIDPRLDESALSPRLTTTKGTAV
jgi:hypothetical protein